MINFPSSRLDYVALVIPDHISPAPGHLFFISKESSIFSLRNPCSGLFLERLSLRFCDNGYCLHFYSPLPQVYSFKTTNCLKTAGPPVVLAVLAQ
ncbi:hypothetical protein BDA96_08G099900 [Sorghum bicolor]|uniref:Uncharacterized protein n=2 Tax=Sorghum bicolor TaxID=4558 RepID=A0A921U7R6_SORBI|nr:hypothetical protein BDA96_08G099900 [Sorghum bicolor]OQU79053.1 hypothetical protein SORBI_3008G089233 [Sorghum bicolor]